MPDMRLLVDQRTMAAREAGNEAYRKGDIPTAIKHYKEALNATADASPEFVKIQKNLAACYLKQVLRRKTRRASKCTEQRETKGERENCTEQQMFSYIQLTLYQGKHSAAIKACDAVLEHEPRDVKALFRRGQAYEAQGDIDKAFKDMAMASKEDKQVL